MRRHHLEQGQARSLALLLSGIDQQAKKAMAPFLAGGILPIDFLPQLRAEVKRLLNEDASRVSATRRLKLTEFAATYGLVTKGAEPRTRRHVVKLTDGEDERVRLAAAAVNKPVAVWMREAIYEKLARQ